MDVKIEAAESDCDSLQLDSPDRVDVKMELNSDESDCDDGLRLTPSEVDETNIVKSAKISSLNLLPEKSRGRYEITYKWFMDWRKKNKMMSLSENVLMAYFGEISRKFKPTTLWTQYSMLRITLSIYNNIDIESYSKVKAFLKRQSDGYLPKKSKTLTSAQIEKFIKEAPDKSFLLIKVALIMGVMGACRRHELYHLSVDNLEDLGSAVIVTIPNTKTKVPRIFTITGRFYNIYKKYADLRPRAVMDPHFFLNYQNGKCNHQRLGINKFGNMGKEIAKYLKLSNSELYTGHCFRRSSGKIFIDSGDVNEIPPKRQRVLFNTSANLHLVETGAGPSNLHTLKDQRRDDQRAPNNAEPEQGQENDGSRSSSLDEIIQNGTDTDILTSPVDVLESFQTSVLVDLSDSDFNKMDRCIDFVDKSLLAWHFFNDCDSRVLVTAPARFGKSTNMNMLDRFFGIQTNSEGLRFANVKKEGGKLMEDPSNMSENFKVFKTKRIFQECRCNPDRQECDNCKQWFYMHCGQHPVISVDFGCIISRSLMSVISSLKEVIKKVYKKHFYLVKEINGRYVWSSTGTSIMGTHHINSFLKYYSDEEHVMFWWNKSTTSEDKQTYLLEALPLLTEFLNLHFRKPVLVLIDEYDTPVTELIFQKGKKEVVHQNIEDISYFIQHWTCALLNGPDSFKYVRKALVTARVAPVGVLSFGASNMQMRKFLDNNNYSESYGFTEEEVESIVDKYVCLGQITKSKEEVLQHINEWYGGYFTVWKNTKIYSNLSVIHYLRSERAQTYWYDRVCSKQLSDFLTEKPFKHKLFTLLREGRPSLRIAKFEQIETGDVCSLNTVINTNLPEYANTENIDLFFRFMSDYGFFNVSSIAPTEFKICVPNYEVECRLRQTTLSGLLGKVTANFDNSKVAALVNSLALLRENNKSLYIDFAKCIVRLYSNMKVPENDFELQANLYRIASNSGEFICDAELRIDVGNLPRIDMFLIINGTAIVINVKHYTTAKWADAALEEILDIGYYKVCQGKYQDMIDGNVILIGVFFDSDEKVSLSYLANIEEEKDKEDIMKGRICVDSDEETLYVVVCIYSDSSHKRTLTRPTILSTCGRCPLAGISVGTTINLTFTVFIWNFIR